MPNKLEDFTAWVAHCVLRAIVLAGESYANLSVIINLGRVIYYQKMLNMVYYFVNTSHNFGNVLYITVTKYTPTKRNYTASVYN